MTEQASAANPSSKNDEVDVVLGEDESAAACLLTVDDNHFLVEWLACHYHVLSLRHLIVAVDPRSKTSPDHIFKRWEGRMDIEAWYDESRYLGNTDDFQDRVEKRRQSYYGHEAATSQLLTHRQRQWDFNMECMRTHKKRNRGWTTLLDPDEYLYTNPIIRDPQSDMYSAKWKSLPALSKPGSVVHMLKQLQFPNKDYDVTSPCVRIVRRQCSSRDDDKGENDQNAGELPHDQEFDPNAFQTLRWKYWGFKDKDHPRLVGKAMVGLARLRLIDLYHEGNEGDPHRPLGSTCSAETAFQKESEALLLASHYLGTREQWECRGDDARGAECLKDLLTHQNNVIGKVRGSDVREWLGGFIDTVGLSEAKRLLKDAGKTEPKPANRVPTKKNSEADTDVDKGKTALTNIIKAGDSVEIWDDDEEKWYPSATVVASNCRGGYDVRYEGGENEGGWDWSIQLEGMRRPGSEISLQDEFDRFQTAQISKPSYR